MSLFATPHHDFPLWDYMIGNMHTEPDLFDGIYKEGRYGLSIVTNRFHYLRELSQNKNMKLALKNPNSIQWTKWIPFPGKLIEFKRNSLGYGVSASLACAVDAHRSILPNEVVIESDYPTYEQNYDASKLVGAILEHKGFTPHYYYSGNKSVHVHVFFDWNCLKGTDDIIQDQLKVMFSNSQSRFRNSFMQWLRTKMVNCWDTKARQFDSDLVKASHLIRTELSRNKLGFKTFLGYTYKDMSFVPYVCNEENRIYPRLGEVRLSSPRESVQLIEEFHDDMKFRSKRQQVIRKNTRLGKWVELPKESIRGCVKAILSEDFIKLNDGHGRGMFILVNELKRILGEQQARIIISDWNSRLGHTIPTGEIEYRFKSKNYTLSCKYIHRVLEDLGFDVAAHCRRKLYK